MSPVAYLWAALAAIGTVAVLILSGRAWKRQRNPIDLAYAVAAAGSLVYLLASSARSVTSPTPLGEFAAYAGYQTVIVAVSFFLLVSASVTRFEIHAVWMTQGMVGLLLLAWYAWGPQHQATSLYMLWVALNLACAGALLLYVGLSVYRMGSYRCWLVLGASQLGLGICIQDLLAADQLRLGVTLAQYVYATFLLLLWLLITNRVGHAESAAGPGTDRLPGSPWETITGFGPATDFAAAAVTGERRRIAQDLHDGVGSQLVNILATLDIHAPQQQAIALALEQCLLDLKIMVDTIDSGDVSVIDALGSLRYRVQHSLDKLDIRMVWKVDVDGPLQAFRGERAQQVLRITQECLSNVMRHAQAGVVEVVCRYVPESDDMLLDVRDNGCGMVSREAGRPEGKGLESMRWRARKLGGHLQIVTKARAGTQVRLLVPLWAPDADG